MPTVSTEKIRAWTYWRHIKSNKLYQVIGIAESKAQDRVLSGIAQVVYMRDILYVRPLDEWLERFEYVGKATCKYPIFFMPIEEFTVTLPSGQINYKLGQYYLAGGFIELRTDGSLSFCGGHGCYEYVDSDKFEILRMQ